MSETKTAELSSGKATFPQWILQHIITKKNLQLSICVEGIQCTIRSGDNMRANWGGGSEKIRER